MKKFAIVLAVMLGIFCLNGVVFADVIVQNTVPKERTTFSEYEKALEHYNKGEYQKSIDILKDYIKQTPDPWGYWLMGYSLYKLKRFDEANQYFKNAFLVDPSFSPTPTLEKQLKHPYEPARPEGYPEGMGPKATPAPIPKLQQGTRVVTEPPPAAEQPMAEPAQEAPAPVVSPAPVPAPQTQAPVPAPSTIEQAPAEVPPPGGSPVPAPATQQEAQAPAQPEAPQEVAPPPPPPAPQPAPKPVPNPFKKPSAPPSGMIEGVGLPVLLLIIVLSLLIYIFFCLIIYKIAKKLNVGAPILAFIPIAQSWTLAACAGMSTGMTIVLFLLQWVLSPIALAIIFLKIAEQMGKSKALGFIVGLLYLIPIFWLVAWFAYARGKAEVSMASTGLGGMPDLSGEPDIPDLDFDLEEEEPAPRAKPSTKAKEEPTSYDDDWQLPEEESGGGQKADEWQLPEESDQENQSVDDWQLPQDDEELK